MSIIFENNSYASFDEFLNNQNAVHKEKDIGLEFAHPVDGAVIKVLETGAIKKVFNEAVQFLVSAQQGLLLSSGIAVNHSNFPELYDVLSDCCNTLAIPIPYTVVTNEFPDINAMATGTDNFSFIAISNYIPKLLTIEEQKFIIAHECGHIALGHVVYHTATSMIANFSKLIPIIGPITANTISFPLNAWSRCSEITADRAGLICCGDLETAQRALLKIIGGFTEIENIDIKKYIEQSHATLEVQGIGKYQELFRQHPLIYKRLKALEIFSQSEMYYRITGKENVHGVKLLSNELLNKSINKLIKII